MHKHGRFFQPVSEKACSKSIALSELQILGLRYGTQVRSNITSMLWFAYDHTIATVHSSYLCATPEVSLYNVLSNSLSPG